jgi:hypothetical protein
MARLQYLLCRGEFGARDIITPNQLENLSSQAEGLAEMEGPNQVCTRILMLPSFCAANFCVDCLSGLDNQYSLFTLCQH